MARSTAGSKARSARALLVLVALATAAAVAGPGAGTGWAAQPGAVAAGADDSSDKDKKKAKKKKDAKSTSADAGTATLTIDGTTWNLTAAEGDCTVGRKIKQGSSTIVLSVRSFKGTDGTVDVEITADPKNPTLSKARVRAVSGDDPFWDGGIGREGSITTKGKTTSGSYSFISPIKDAEAVAARQDPQSYPGTFTFTC